MQNALIIFVRNPDHGKVKTRIAKVLGDDIALKVYETLLDKTHAVTEDLNVDRFIFYSDYIPPVDLWEQHKFYKALQHGTGLGERMKNAFKEVFDKGYTNVAIIGSDCFDLTQTLIMEGFALLNKSDVVAGPSLDGGYYLLGMKIFIPELFLNIPWSTSAVYKATCQKAQSMGHAVSALPPLSDVDEIYDITFSY